MFVLKGKIFRKSEKTSQKGNRFFNYTVLDDEFDKYFVASDVSVPEDAHVEIECSVRAYATKDGRAGLNIWGNEITVLKKNLRGLEKKKTASGGVVL